jgi:arylsulfatase G
MRPWSLLSAVAAASAAPKPNFVVLFGDDWGWGDLGANWPDAAGMTPNLDALAGEGIRFTDFHVGASVCSVSRAALLTGRLGVRTGVVTNFAIDAVAGLPRSENTIAELLKPAGYRTAAIGKWHLGTAPGFHPSYRGFDRYLGLPYSVDMGCTDSLKWDRPHRGGCNKQQGPTEHQWVLPLPLYQSNGPNCTGLVNGTGAHCNGDIIEAPVDFATLSDKYAAFAEEFIGNATANAGNAQQPFFLYVPFSHVHTPQYVTPANAGRSGKTGDAGHFYDSLMELDQTVGKIMAALKKAGVDDNTLVFVSGDNGPWETKCNLTGSVGPFTGLWQKREGGGGSSAKTTLWEGGHREVGLARWPGRIAPRVSNATVSSLDLLPTIASLAGVALPADRVYDGVDLSPVLLQAAEHAHDTLFHPNSGAEGGVMGKLDGVRWKNYKAIYQTGGAPDCSGSKGNIQRHDPPLLFNLANDPAESVALDVAQEPHKSALAQIEAALAAQMASVNGTMQSVTDYGRELDAEPCVYLPKSCRSDAPPTPPTPPTPPPPTPPTPPPAPTPVGTCDASQWYNGTIPWNKQTPRAPFQHPVTNSVSATACCDLCNSATNRALGCRFWAWAGPGPAGTCYMKVSVTLCTPHAAQGFVSGSIFPWNSSATGSQ